MRAGEDTFDKDWQLDFAAEVTGGREAGIMRNTDPQELVNTPNWRLWSIDLKTRKGAPVAGLDFKAAGYQDVAVDGRTFLMVPNGDYSETTAHEVVQGKAGFKIQGSSYHMVKVR